MAFSFDPSTKKITLSKGDPLSTNLNLYPYSIETTDILVFTVKTNKDDSLAVLTKSYTGLTGVNPLITILSSDTRALSVGTYYYDFVVLDKDLNILLTTNFPAKFVIEGVIHS